MINISLVLSCGKPSQSLEELVLFAWYHHNPKCMSWTGTHKWLLQSHFHQTVQFSSIHYISELGFFLHFTSEQLWMVPKRIVLCHPVFFLYSSYVSQVRTQHTDPTGVHSNYVVKRAAEKRWYKWTDGGQGVETPIIPFGLKFLNYHIFKPFFFCAIFIMYLYIHTLYTQLSNASNTIYCHIMRSVH